jgi:hypothetical protein
MELRLHHDDGEGAGLYATHVTLIGDLDHTVSDLLSAGFNGTGFPNRRKSGISSLAAVTFSAGSRVGRGLISCCSGSAKASEQQQLRVCQPLIWQSKRAFEPYSR